MLAGWGQAGKSLENEGKEIMLDAVGKGKPTEGGKEQDELGKAKS